MVFGLQTQPKSWLTGYTFWVNHYLEIVFSKISVVNPPPPPPLNVFPALCKYVGNVRAYTVDNIEAPMGDCLYPTMLAVDGGDLQSRDDSYTGLIHTDQTYLHKL